jgi:hypothetical protein
MERILTPAQRDLFQQMAPNDQRHSINVCAALRRAGDDDPDLLVAALLHDVGKAAGRIWLWQRTLIVLLQRCAPALLVRVARAPNPSAAQWWRRGFVINQFHPELGARWAARAGCSPTTVALIRRHQEPVLSINSEQDRLLAALQRADGVN